MVSFPDPPSISLDIKLVGGLEVNRVPWLRNVVSDATKTWIKEEMLWPQRMIIPAEKPSQLWKNSSAPEYVLSKPELQTVLLHLKTAETRRDQSIKTITPYE